MFAREIAKEASRISMVLLPHNAPRPLANMNISKAGAFRLPLAKIA
jgi:hypothetical protein